MESSTVELNPITEKEPAPAGNVDGDGQEGYLSFIKYCQDKNLGTYFERLPERTACFGTEKARDLYRRVAEHKAQNPASSIDEVMDTFCNEPHGDAIVNMVYQDRLVDYIIKLKEDPKYYAVRAAWEAMLLKRGIYLEYEAAVDPKETYIKLFVPFDLMGKEAESRRINMSLVDQEEPKHRKKETTLQRLVTFFNPEDRVQPEACAPFKMDQIEKFDGGLDQLSPCRGDEPKWKVVRKFFRRGLRNMLTYEIVTHIVLSPSELSEIPNNGVPDNASLGVLRMLRRGIYAKFFPTHDGSHKSKQEQPNMRTTLKKEWALSFIKNQPLDKVREYFGEKFALYFAYLGFYTVWLWSASIVGLIVFIYGIAYAMNADELAVEQRVTRLFDNQLTIPWAVFISVWATVYLEFWKRKNAYLAWWWDVMDFEKEETTRPEWYGTQTRISPITGENEYHYPDKVRFMKMAASCSCIFIADGNPTPTPKPL